jgi:hypothetical protein
MAHRTVESIYPVLKKLDLNMMDLYNLDFELTNWLDWTKLQTLKL